MRLFLLPISTRNSLVYCARTGQKPGGKPSLIDRLTNKASATWAGWEKAESGWKKQLTLYGEKAFRRIPYQEWSLKSIPPLSDARRKATLDENKKVEVLFPSLFLPENRVEGVLRALATERQGLHRSRMIWSIVAMPFTIPFIVIPIIPNIPFFYLVFRAWSHWRALSGANHLQFLLEKNLLTQAPSTSLNEMYAAGLMYPTREKSRGSPIPSIEQAQEVADAVHAQTQAGGQDTMLLRRWNGKLLAERFQLPEMEVEIERAVEQVQHELQSDEAKRQEEGTSSTSKEKTG